jgi:hypothetical protein
VSEHPPQAPSPEAGRLTRTPSEIICPALTETYYALLRQRRDLSSRGEWSELVADHYAAITGDLLLTGIELVASDTAYTLADRVEGRLTPPMLQPYRGWSNFPTWAVDAWLGRDADTATEATGIVVAAGDTEIAGRQLAAYMAERTGGTGDLLAAGLELAEWEEIAWRLSPEAFFNLDEHGNNPCTTWDDDGLEGGDLR